MSTENEAFSSSVHERLELLRHNNGWSIAEMARRAGLPRRSMENYLAGQKPGYDALVSIARGLNVPVDWLCGFSPWSPSQSTRFIAEAAWEETRRILRIIVREQEKGMPVIKDGKVFGRDPNQFAVQLSNDIVQRYINISSEFGGQNSPDET